MPKQVTISCEECGETVSAANYSKLWHMLSQQGWEKGAPRGTYYCPQHGYIALEQLRKKYGVR